MIAGPVAPTQARPSRVAEAGDGQDEQAASLVAHVYELNTQQQIDECYTKWASTYDEELRASGFHAPKRCAAALAKFVSHDEPVLDVGCGTGLSGRALVDAGFSNVSGQDVNAQMLAKAAARGIYRELHIDDSENPFTFEAGTYRAMTASGVISPGAAPASLLTQVLEAMAPGGHVAFTFTDYAMQEMEYVLALAEVFASGKAESVFCEYGPHIQGLGLYSNVYVLRVLR